MRNRTTSNETFHLTSFSVHIGSTSPASMCIEKRNWTSRPFSFSLSVRSLSSPDRHDPRQLTPGDRAHTCRRSYNKYAVKDIPHAEKLKKLFYI